ncbi:hypothetical protein DSCOOX_25060 [Desulfosarcina ovata subsp. ovata]|uniref:ABC transmembrane type-1 domain-containing protein n=1 Tax=Desulfosarcina ovata subsp. ovata TaxID=2752305 RepID=A0A5K8AA00_9BACT|nr:hypothetical protein DSCOOX_25060 [Desulfosarcina ovata subsp. ovata]
MLRDAKANRQLPFIPIVLPLIRPGLLTAAIFAFIASFDELITALFISGARSTTLSRQMCRTTASKINNQPFLNMHHSRKRENAKAQMPNEG